MEDYSVETVSENLNAQDEPYVETENFKVLDGGTVGETGEDEYKVFMSIAAEMGDEYKAAFIRDFDNGVMSGFSMDFSCDIRNFGVIEKTSGKGMTIPVPDLVGMEVKEHFRFAMEMYERLDTKSAKQEMMEYFVSETLAELE